MQEIVCGEIGQGSHTRLSNGPLFLGNSIVSHPRGHGSLVGQTHGGHESVCNSC